MPDLCLFAEARRHQEELVAVGDEGKLEALLPNASLRAGRRIGGPAGVPETTV